MGEFDVARQRTDEEQNAIDALPKPTVEQRAAVLAHLKAQLADRRSKVRGGQRELPNDD